MDPQFFVYPQNSPEDYNRIDIYDPDVIGFNNDNRNIDNRLYILLLNEIQKNNDFRELAFRVGLHDMSNIPYLRLEDWIKLISLIRNKIKEQRLFRFLKEYENSVTLNNSERKLIRDINEQLQNVKFSTGGKRTRKHKRKIIKNKKRSRKNK